MTEGRFNGKVVFVTGAASGLGRATALRFAAEGAQVYAIDVNETGLAETADTAQTSGTALAAVATVDITDRDAAFAAVEDCVARFGHLDVVANVAGVLRNGHVTTMSEADVKLVFGVNVFGMIWVCQAAIPHLVESQGNVVNVASNAGLMGQAYTAVYSASKAAVINLTRALAMEFIKSPVRINAVAPGGIKTPLAFNTTFPDDVDWELIKPYMGFRDMSRSDDIASVILFVASDEARAMHGSIVSADTGLTAG